jgi:23S rRNA-/tRNA-specific pseudouridylate synthase
LSELGHPIVGDTLYGSHGDYYQKLNRHLLHAHALTFEHPITKGIVRVESPVPQVFRKWVSEQP